MNGFFYSHFSLKNTSVAQLCKDCSPAMQGFFKENWEQNNLDQMTVLFFRRYLQLNWKECITNKDQYL